MNITTQTITVKATDSNFDAFCKMTQALNMMGVNINQNRFIANAESARIGEFANAAGIFGIYRDTNTQVLRIGRLV